MIRKEEFKNEIMEAMAEKPASWRKGQFVFNYIDEVYGIARIAQFQKGVDCFFCDDAIDEFIDVCYSILEEFENKSNN